MLGSLLILIFFAQISEDEHIPRVGDKGVEPPVFTKKDLDGFNESWRESNVDFLLDTLSLDYLIDSMITIKTNFQHGGIPATADRFINEIRTSYSDRITKRCFALAEALSTESNDGMASWETLGCD